MVAYDKSRNMIVVSFRATTCGNSWKNGQMDFMYSHVPFMNEKGGKCDKCSIHAGFYATHEWFKPNVRKAVMDLAVKYPSSKILVTGISYGAAIAAIAAYDLRLQTNLEKNQIIAYTFGQPRIGN